MSELDRVVCIECHEDAVIEMRYQGHDHAVPLCSTCVDYIERCPECEQLFWGPEGQRIEGNSRHCARCAAKHPLVVGDVMAGIKADEAFDQFNRTRR